MFSIIKPVSWEVEGHGQRFIDFSESFLILWIVSFATMLWTVPKLLDHTDFHNLNLTFWGFYSPVECSKQCFSNSQCAYNKGLNTKYLALDSIEHRLKSHCILSFFLESGLYISAVFPPFCCHSSISEAQTMLSNPLVCSEKTKNIYK